MPLTDRDFSHELTRFRPYRSRERNNVVMTSLFYKMIGDGMISECFLPLWVSGRIRDAPAVGNHSP